MYVRAEISHVWHVDGLSCDRFNSVDSCSYTVLLLIIDGIS